MSTITKRQAEVLSFIKTYYDKWDCAPTLKEIAQVFNTSYQSIWTTINALETAGRIKREPNKERGIEIV